MTDKTDILGQIGGVGVVRVTTPPRYDWTCPEQHCRFTTSTDSHADTNAAAKRHVDMHKVAIPGTRVVIEWGRRGGSDLWPARPGDTGTISHAYVDQDRFIVELDRKGKCEGCRHCSGCGGPTTLTVTSRFVSIDPIYSTRPMVK